MLGPTTKVVLGDIANRVLAADHYYMTVVIGERNDVYEQGRESKRKQPVGVYQQQDEQRNGTCPKDRRGCGEEG